uniref:PSA1 n=1 Tax=Arundo donax TaxID=35708 RepID=A0A0A9BJG4_ARUDO
MDLGPQIAREKSKSRSFDNVPEPVRHRRDDMEPRGAALPGRVHDGGRQAGLRLRRPLLQHPRRPRRRQQVRLRALLPPAQGLPRRRPRGGSARGAHCRRPRPIPVPPLGVHQPRLRLRGAPPHLQARAPPRRQSADLYRSLVLLM